MKWWPLTRKIAGALAAYLSALSVAVVGELTTGAPTWQAVATGAVPGGVAVVTGYLLSDPSSPGAVE